MKKTLAFLALFLASMTGLAQQATVTATIASYAGGSARAFFVNQGGGSPTINQASGTINSSGVFSLNAWNNSYSVYAPSQTQVIICGPFPYASTCYSALVNITSSSQDISSSLSGAPTPGGGSACATCVVASSPGVGIAHFAGSTQTVTSSLVGIADLSATGTASSATFLRGDNTWAAAGGSISGLTTGFIPKALSGTSVGNSAMDDGVTTSNQLTYGGSAGMAAKKFVVTDTVNNSATTYATGSGGDSTCPAPLSGTSYQCSKSSGISASINGAPYTPIAGAITPTSMIASGIADGQAAMTVTTGSSATLGGTYSAGYTVNENATAATAVTYTLPTAVAGKQYCVANGYNGSAANTGALEILTSASGQFIIFTDGTLSATGGFVISGGAAGDKACVVGVDSTHWLLYVQAGTWTKH